MAIDTRSKRTSAGTVGVVTRTSRPYPDGAIDQGDRQHIAFLYSGILAGAPSVVLVPDLECPVHLSYLEAPHRMLYPASFILPLPDDLNLSALDAPHITDYNNKKIHVRCPYG